VGYLCGRCSGWNGPDPKKKSLNSQDKTTEEREDDEKKSVDRSAGNNDKTNEINVPDERQGDIGEKATGVK